MELGGARGIFISHKTPKKIFKRKETWELINNIRNKVNISKKNIQKAT